MALPYSLIVAYSRNRVIGRDNQLPWRLRGDLAHFKRTTLGQPILMGRKTWESLGRPLPGRTNIVITRNPGYVAEGAVVVTSLAEALAACGDAPHAFVIGGAQIYGEALPGATQLIATEVDVDTEGDAFFPPLPEGHWDEVAREAQPEEDGLRYDFVTYRRRT
ncbi:dihydrofolate reductase [Pigmentiphaga litoralis]|uniref:dihydrofolate reductase n=1 Tax=Pigmentiphaga litoralis TaxID=516702 RepID=UPI003B438467